MTTTTCTPVTLSGATLGAGIYVFETGVTITGATTIGVGSGELTTKGTEGATVVVYRRRHLRQWHGNDILPIMPLPAVPITELRSTSPLSDTNQLLLQFGSGSSIFKGAVLAPSADSGLFMTRGAPSMPLT